MWLKATEETRIALAVCLIYICLCACVYFIDITSAVEANVEHARPLPEQIPYWWTDDSE